MKSPNKIKSLCSFTLIELILGLLIASIIGVSIYNMFWSAMKLDEKMHRIHDNYMELLMANYGLVHDLENAVNLDYSMSYPDALIFDGSKDKFSFLEQTPMGIKRVTYYTGLPERGRITKTLIGRVVNHLSHVTTSSNQELPVEFLLRKQSSLSDWLNENTNDTQVQVIAAGIKKASFNCQYAAADKDTHASSVKVLDYKDTWAEKTLPMAVSCSFVLYDPKRPEEGLPLKKEIFLAPLAVHAG